MIRLRENIATIGGLTVMLVALLTGAAAGGWMAREAHESFAKLDDAADSGPARRVVELSRPEHGPLLLSVRRGGEEIGRCWNSDAGLYGVSRCQTADGGRGWCEAAWPCMRSAVWLPTGTVPDEIR